MERPKPIVLMLTDEQYEDLLPHYEYVHQQFQAGKPGILAAQVGDTRFGGRRFIKVGFVENSIAETIAHSAS